MIDNQEIIKLIEKNTKLVYLNNYFYFDGIKVFNIVELKSILHLVIINRDDYLINQILKEFNRLKKQNE